MSEFKGIIGLDGKPLRVDRREDVRGKYEAAQTRDMDYRHWMMVDELSAAAANSPEVRKTLRERSRYEFDNNGYYSGLIESIAQDTIGSGPRPQVSVIGAMDDSESDDVARLIEAGWNRWASDDVVDYADKLRIGDESELRDGESFDLFINNPAVSDQVKLDILVIETDQVATPGVGGIKAGDVDGIEFDNKRNPIAYHVLSDHPGNSDYRLTFTAERIPSDLMCHWFRPKRPGAARGVPILTPGIPLMAQVRRFCESTLTAAEWAAKISGILYTDLPPDEEGNEVSAKGFERYQLPGGTVLTAPLGYKIEQLSPQHPSDRYGEFKGENLDEIGRAAHAPSNVVRGNSRDYNFSSGRLDYVLYHKAIRVRRRRMKTRKLNRTFRAWYAEASRIPDYFGKGVRVPPVSQISIAWYWDGFESIDPQKDADANKINLEMGLTTYAELCAEDGIDWQDRFRQRSREEKLAKELGITLAYKSGMAATPLAQDNPMAARVSHIEKLLASMSGRNGSHA